MLFHLPEFLSPYTKREKDATTALPLIMCQYSSLTTKLFGRATMHTRNKIYVKSL